MDRLIALKVFIKVVDEGSFTAAANALDMSTPTITRHIADLEKALGIRLLHRSTRRLALTTIGERYLSRIRPIVQELDEADIEVKKQTEEIAGPIHIAASTVLATFLLAAVIAKFSERYPNVIFHTHVSNDPVSFIEDHDVTLFNVRPPFDSNLIARKIVDASTVLLASPQYIERFGAPSSPAELPDHRYLAYQASGERNSKINIHLVNNNDQCMDVEISPFMYANHVETLIRASQEGAGIVALTSGIASAQIDKGELVHILKDWTSDKYILYAALPSRKFIPKRIQIFLDFLSEYCINRKKYE